MSGSLPWLTLAGLGAYHGLNPAMGWLFAVSRGMQERSRRAVLRSLLPIAVGHELSIALVAVAVLVGASLLDPVALRIGAAAVLLAFGIFRFVKPRAHPRWTRMQVRPRELALWSFLMSSAHGAGLMVAPVLIGLQAEARPAHDHAHELAAGTVASVGALPGNVLGIALHVGAMVVVMGVVAVVVYEKLGVAVLRRAWLNTDALWAGSFVLAAALTLFG